MLKSHSILKRFSALLFVCLISVLSHATTFTLSVTVTTAVSAGSGSSGSVTDNTSAINCPGTCSASYSSGTNVLLTATPSAGYTFTGWAGGFGSPCSGTGTCNVVMSQAWAVTAVFTATPDTTFVSESYGNTSACGPTGTPSYCFATWATSALPNLTTRTANTNAQTVFLAPAGNISSVTIPASYLYPGFTGQILFGYQPWFAPTSGPYTCFPYPMGGLITQPAHPCSGYNENLPAVIAAQHNEMIALGQGGSNTVVDVPDYYGNINGSGFLEATVVQEAADAASRCAGSVCPILFAVMIDKGLFTSGMAVSGVNSAAPACAAASCTTAQIIALYEAALDHIDGLWANNPYYAPSPTNSSHHALYTFLVESNFPLVNWTTVNSTVTSYMAKYSHPYDIFHWSGGFTEANQAGAYLWVKPQPYTNSAPASQYVLDNGNGYQSGFYNSAQSSGQTGIGGLFIGFDGSNNNYNQGLMSRECGQTIQFYSNAILNATPTHYSNSFPLPAVMVGPYNDLGEGTNIEGGIDNCWRQNTPSYNASTSTLTWTVSATDTSSHGAVQATIHHFNIYFGDGTGPLYLAQANITPSAAGCAGSTILSCSFNLNGATKPPFGGYTWNVYVKMVPQALGFTGINGGGNGNGPPLSYFFPGPSPPPTPSTQIPVSSHLVDGSGNPAAGAYLKFDLWNCGANFPIVTGAPWVVVKRSFTILANSAGIATGLVVPNDLITCGNVVSTRWIVSTVLAGASPLNASERFNILSTGGTFDPSTYQPDSPNPPPPPGFSSLFGNPVANQTWRQPAGTSAQFYGTFDFSNATLKGLAAPALNINGVSIPSVNLNSATPAADPGYTAATFKGSGANYIAEVPTPCTSNCTLGGTTTHSGVTQAQGEIFANAGADLVNSPLLTEIANCSGGTTVNKLAKLIVSGSAACAVITATSDTANIEGVVFATGGTSGNAAIGKNGQLSCIFDGATTANDFVVNSTTVAGDCHDAGATAPTTSQNIGTVLSTNGAGGLYSIRVASGSGSGGGGGSGNTTTSPSMTANQLPVATGPTAQKGSQFSDDGTTGAYNGTHFTAPDITINGTGWPMVTPLGASAVPMELGGGSGLNASDVCQQGATCQGVANSGGFLPASVIPDISGTYVTQSELGQPSGVPQLNASGQVIQPVVDGVTNFHPTNCTSTGTTLNELVSLINGGVGGSYCATTTPAASTGGVVGICISGCGNSGTATVQQVGLATCIVDAPIAAQFNYLKVSPSVAGNCSDAGSTYPNVGQVLGIATGTTSPVLANLSLSSEAHGSPAYTIPNSTTLTNFYAATAVNGVLTPRNIGPNDLVFIGAADTTHTNAYVLTPSQAATSLATYLPFPAVMTNANNSGNVHIAISGLTSTSVKKCGTQSLAIGDIAAGAVEWYFFDGTNFQLLNPQAAPCQQTISSGVIPLAQGAGAANIASDLQDSSSVINSSVGFSQAVTYAGGQDVAAGAALGGVTVRGANQTGAGALTSAGGPVYVHGGNNAATNVSSQAGSNESTPGASTGATNQGLQGLQIENTVYAKGATVTQWNLECYGAAAQTVTDCGATPSSFIGVAEVVNTNTVQVTVAGQIFINASAAVTLGHTVCAGASAGQITDSGGTGGCPSGSTVGIVIATSKTWTLPDGTSVTATTTLPLIQLGAHPAASTSQSVKRLDFNQATTLVAGDFTVGAGWGSTAALAITLATSKDQASVTTITTGGTGIVANPTLVLTFHDGTFTQVPACTAVQTGGNDILGNFTVTSRSATAYTFQWNATPTTAKTYEVTILCSGT